MPNPRLYPKLSNQAIVQSKGFDPSVPSPLSQAYSRRMAEQQVADQKLKDMSLSPLDKAIAGLEAVAMAGSVMFEAIQQAPKLLQGEDAYAQAIGNRLYTPRVQPEKAGEYLGSALDAIDSLQTDYKLPPIMPELAGFQPLMAAANQQATQAAKRGALQAGMNLERSLDQPVTNIMNRGGFGAEMLGSFNTPPAQVIKPKGGNWLQYHPSEQLKPLRKTTAAGSDPAEMLKQMKEQWTPEEIERVASTNPSLSNVRESIPHQMDHLEKQAIINNWVDSNLNNYVKNEMGTPNDPVRLGIEKRGKDVEQMRINAEAKLQRMDDKIASAEATATTDDDMRKLANMKRTRSQQMVELGNEIRLAEQHVTHLNQDRMERFGDWTPDTLGTKREAEGFPAEGMSTYAPARTWETIADLSIEPHSPEWIKQQAKEYDVPRSKQLLAQNPWIEKVEGDKSVYSGRTAPFGLNDFQHVIDVLDQDIASGRLRPEQLNKVSVEQAIARTVEYDKELAREMYKQNVKNMEDMVVHKEYPSGYKWVQLDKPGHFASESKSMGHSVKGYEPHKGHPDWVEGSGEEGSPYYGYGGWDAIKSGKAKVYSLVDPFNEPHVTVEVGSSGPKEAALKAMPKEVQDAFNKRIDDWVGSIDYVPSREEIMQETGRLFEEFNIPTSQEINQIKGKGNRRPVEKYDEYTQDFVKGGNWEGVRDLEHTGLYNVNKDFLGGLADFMPQAEDIKHLNKQQRMQALANAMDAGDLQSGYATRADWEDAIRKHGRPTIGEADDELLSQLQPPPPAEGMKAGGRVHVSDNPDTMAMELEDQKFQVGGIVDKAVRLAKAAKAAEMKQAMKASEALAKIEGKRLNITQADRTKVGQGFLGGPGFSGLQLQEGPHKDVGAVWGVKNVGTAKTMLGGFKDPLGKEYFTTMIGSPTQHQSNQMVFDKLYNQFKAEAKKGNLDPELRDKINARLAAAVDKDGNPVFPSDVDILDKNFKKQATTFDQRAIAGNVIGGTGVGGKKGQIIDYDKIIRETTDPFLLDAPSGSLGYRLWTPSGEIIERPDLHPAFPAIATGEDLGVEFTPAAQDILMAPWVENVRQTKGRNPGYMDWTRGRPPSVEVTEDILTNLQKSGNKAGGLIKVKRKAGGGIIKKAIQTAGKAATAPATRRLEMSFKDVAKPVPELTEASQKLKAGQLSREDYEALVNKHKPVTPYNFVPQPATAEDATRALNVTQRTKFGKVQDIAAGTPTGLRLDINAYKDHGVWVNSIHPKDMPTTYNNVSSVTNAEMVMPEDKALEVATREKNKSPFAVIKGGWNPINEEEAVARAQEYLNHPDWVQVGIDPERHGYYYNRATMEPIVKAEEVIQIGPLVLSKNPVTAPKEAFKYARGGAITANDLILTERPL